MKRRLTWVVLLVMLASLMVACTTSEETTPGPGQPGEVIQLKFATYESEAHYRTPFMREFAAELDKRTGGRTETTIYIGGALGTGMELNDNMLSGVSDMIFIAARLTQGFVPTVDLIGGTPFITDALPFAQVCWHLHNLGYLEVPGAKILMMQGTEQGAQYFKSKKVTKLEEYNGMKFAGPGAAAPMWESLGCAFVAVPPPDLYPSLERGVIEGGTAGVGLITATKMYEIAKYVMLNATSQDCHMCLMNVDKFNSLPAEVQVALLELSREMNSELYELIYEEGAKSIAVIEGAGVETYRLSPEEFARLVREMEPVRLRAAADMDAKGLHGTEILNISTDYMKMLGIFK